MMINYLRSMDWFSRENLNRKPWFLPSNLMGFPVSIFPSSNSMNRRKWFFNDDLVGGFLPYPSEK